MNFAAILNTPVRQLISRKRPEPKPVLMGPKPRMGATLCSAGLRMTVQAGMTDEMWRWLATLGWRELRTGEHRLHYRALSSLLVNRLYDVSPDDRQKVLLLAIREATRPSRSGAGAERSPMS
jgi:hypothetical protein